MSQHGVSAEGVLQCLGHGHSSFVYTPDGAHVEWQTKWLLLRTGRWSPRRVQFDRRELGVELVKDIDVMPIDPGDNLPPTVLAAERELLLNGRRWAGGLPLRPRLTAVPGQVRCRRLHAT